MCFFVLILVIGEALDYNVFVLEIPDTVGVLSAALFAIGRSPEEDCRKSRG